MKAYLTVGNWGDCYAGLGNVLAKEGPGASVNIVHYGPDPAIGEFIGQQPFVRQSIMLTAGADYQRRAGILAFGCCENFIREVEELRKEAGVEMLEPCQARPREAEPARWFWPAVPRSKYVERLNTGEEVRPHPGPLPQEREKTTQVLVNPYSTDLTPAGEHWPCWEEAIEWMVGTYPEVRFHLVGKKARPNPLPQERENMVDHRGLMESNNDVLALADRCDAIVTTSNNLSMWSMMTHKPAVVCCHQAMTAAKWAGRKDPNRYYRRWIEQPHYRTAEDEPSNLLVEHHEGMFEFRGALGALGVLGALDE